MDKKKVELAAVAVLALVFIVIFGRSIVTVRAKLAVMSSGNSAAEVRAVTAGSVDAPVRQKAPVPREARWGRDPFVLQESSQAAVSGVSGLRLMGITANMNTKKPVAIINNEIVGVGGRIGVFKVMRIQKNSVTVFDGEKEYVLRME